MGIFTDGDNEEDELFDLYMLNEIYKDSGGKANKTAYSGGGCLTCLLFIIYDRNSFFVYNGMFVGFCLEKR